MAKDYQNLLDYAASLQQPAQPQQQMPLASELPGPQPATGPQTGGGAQGLLDVLGSIGSGIGTGLLGVLQAIPEVAAYRQAALGQPEALQMLQEQRRQQNLLNQLNFMVQQPEVAPYKEAIQQRLKLGDIEGAQKLVTDLPRQAKFQEMIMSSPSLTDEQKTGIIQQSQISLSGALGEYNKMLSEQRQQKGRFAFEASKEQARVARDEKRAAAQLEAEQRKRNPLNILTEAVKEGVLGQDSTQEEITGVLLSRQAILPANDTQRKTQIKQLLQSPQLKTLFPNANLSWWEKIFGASQTAAATTTPTAQPATKTIRLRSASGQEREVADTPANRALAKQKNMQIIQ